VLEIIISNELNAVLFIGQKPTIEE